MENSRICIGESNWTDDDSAHSNNSDFIQSSCIKLEPKDSCDDDYDLTKSRFNLRKRKPSFTQESLNPLDKDLEQNYNLEDENVKKKRKKMQYSYTSKMLQEALDLVHSQNISIMNAANQYGIPRSTLRRYALTVWAAAAPKAKHRQETALTPPEEAHLVSMITKMSRAGKYVSTMDVKSTVQHLLDESQRVVFKDRNRPNAGWVQRFRKRHCDLQIKGSGYTQKKQTPLSKQDVAEWYNEVIKYLAVDWEIDHNHFFAEEGNRQRIFNIDEMTVLMNNKSDLAEENIMKTDEDMSEVTVLAAVSSAGECLQPLIIQKGEGGGHEDDIMPLDQNSYGISFSISGKMNSDIFMRWLEAFDRELCEKNIKKPIVIFLDDLFAHFHISVFSYAIDNDIILICLHSQTGTIFHPVEAEITEKVREAYQQLCVETYRMDRVPISMDQFPLIFLKAWEAVRTDKDLKDRLIKSFSTLGLVPFDSKATVYEDFPEYPEMSLKESNKLDGIKRSYKRKEAKARKTVTAKEPTEYLIPKVKIKKLEKDLKANQYKIVSEEGESQIFSESVKSLQEMLDPLSVVEPELGSLFTDSANLSQSYIQNANGSFQINPCISQERLEGRQDGIRKCIDLMESFIPDDIMAVWRNRSNKLKTSSEIPFCMWKSAHGLAQEMNNQLKSICSEKTLPSVVPF